MSEALWRQVEGPPGAQIWNNLSIKTNNYSGFTYTKPAPKCKIHELKIQ